MTIIEEFFNHLTRIDQKSEQRVLEIGAKTIYYIIYLLLTFWISEYIGYPIPTDIFSQITIHKLFAEYYVIIPVSIFLALYFGITLLTFLISYAIFWSITLWIIYYLRYGLIYIVDFRSKELKIKLLNKRNEKLLKDLSDPKDFEIDPATKNNSLVLTFMSELSISFLFAYFLIVQNSFPDLTSGALKGVLISVSGIILLINSVYYYAPKYKYFTERLIRRTNRNLRKLSIGDSE